MHCIVVVLQAPTYWTSLAWAPSGAQSASEAHARCVVPARKFVHGTPMGDGTQIGAAPLVSQVKPAGHIMLASQAATQTRSNVPRPKNARSTHVPVKAPEGSTQSALVLQGAHALATGATHAPLATSHAPVAPPHSSCASVQATHWLASG